MPLCIKTNIYTFNINTNQHINYIHESLRGILNQNKEGVFIISKVFIIYIDKFLISVFCCHKFDKLRHIRSLPIKWLYICFFLIHYTKNIQVKVKFVFQIMYTSSTFSFIYLIFESKAWYTLSTLVTGLKQYCFGVSLVMLSVSDHIPMPHIQSNTAFLELKQNCLNVSRPSGVQSL